MIPVQHAMSPFVAWLLIALGVGHVLYGFYRFGTPLREAVADGFGGRFGKPEVRRTAFWFVILGPMLVLTGHLALHAASVGDVSAIRLIGLYLLGVSLVGVCAFPRSPFSAGIVVAVLLLAQAWGQIP